MKLIPIALLVSPAAIFAMLGDATGAALIAGGFTVLNTFLLFRLQRPVTRTHQALVAPRRIIYDAEGRPIGTVLDLRGDSDFDMDALLVSSQRRRDDPEGE